MKLGGERRRELRAHVLRREAQGRALSVLRAQRLSVQQQADVRSVLGSSSMLVAGGEADMIERHWLRQVTQELRCCSCKCGVQQPLRVQW